MKNIFISPHQDDVVFSCGGLIKKLNGDCIVVTIFTGSYNLLTEWDKACGFKNGSRPWQTRNEEDIKALAKLGAKYEHLNLLQTRYQKCSKDTRHTQSITDAILEFITLNVTAEKIYAPLGIGNKDHEFIRSILLDHYHRSAVDMSHELFFYEDFPYIVRQDWTDKAFRFFGRNNFILSPVFVNTTAQFEDKLDAILTYKSQIKQVMNSVFSKPSINALNDYREMISHMLRIYSKKIAPIEDQSSHCYYEQYWKFKSQKGGGILC